jgi:hypothetical protein
VADALFFDNDLTVLFFDNVFPSFDDDVKKNLAILDSVLEPFA